METAKRLELLRVDGRYRIHSSLFDVLNYCVTAIGKRTLRARILEPLCDVTIIRSHHECIQELNSVANIQMKPIIAGLLKNFSHVDRLHKLALAIPQEDNVRMAEMLINQTIQLRMCLRLVPVLRIKLDALQCKPFDDIKNGLADERYQLMLDHIDSVLSKELAAYHSDGSNQIHQRVNCIQGGKNDLVDMMRKIFNDLMKELHGEPRWKSMRVKYIVPSFGRFDIEFVHAIRTSVQVTAQFDARVSYEADGVRRDDGVGHSRRTGRGKDGVAVFRQPNAQRDPFSARNEAELLPAVGVGAEEAQHSHQRSRRRDNNPKQRVRKTSLSLFSILRSTHSFPVFVFRILAQMLTEITAEIDAVYDLTGIVATLDIAVALATVNHFAPLALPRPPPRRPHERASARERAKKKNGRKLNVITSIR